ncbi:MAG: phytoene synthase [Flavobacteriales bacterium CG_4_9_14_3_um_filter_40_17]|nr:MAG: phytoene synthase [Flavobacteriales bacterium CG_4_9_14_3_um_filter_40_17]
MKALFDQVSFSFSYQVTKTYSTSFSVASRLLASSIRQDIYNIYGFVRLADEIVDSFQGYQQEDLFNDFENQLYDALNKKVSLNPVLNAFQHTYHKYKLEFETVKSFMHSMRLDLRKSVYKTQQEYQEYIYGSADVVGLMCLKVFVNGDANRYDQLKEQAVKLGSAFQKVNFLRDLKADHDLLNRSYFPGVNLDELDEKSKLKLIEEIEIDFKQAYQGIIRLPVEARLGVYTAYVYYLSLLKKLKKTPSVEIKNTRIRVPNYEKFGLLAQSYMRYRLNIL